MRLLTSSGSSETSKATTAAKDTFGIGIPQGISRNRAVQGGGKPGTSPEGVVVDYHCSGSYRRKSGSSFPSGHATAVGYEAAFLFAQCVYKLWSLHKPFQAAALGLVLAACALFMCLDRVIYHHNHVIDVLCGFSVGAAGGAVFALWPYHDEVEDM
ncbi:hypothetical protein V5799_019899 [Amblyomma americanum]|uniref:Phosphatidic acid phosphatase type 2/haloperoxidase domain-containing protein n=1 Tax=Amblyomma americanum TaxID=6943 RepID=A0AAQ4EVL6_AMBAM